VDKLSKGQAAERMRAIAKELELDPDQMIAFSAVTGEGIPALLARIDAMLEQDPVSRARLRVPQREGKALALLEASARVLSRAYEDGVVELEVDAPESVLRRMQAFRA